MEVNQKVLEQIPGAADLVAWFGRFPSFHDANIVDFFVTGEGKAQLKAKTFCMTDKVDDKGYFVLDKHCLVALHFDDLTEIKLKDFMPGQAILFSLAIAKDGGLFVVSLDSSYGLGGTLKGRKLRIEFESTTAG